MIIYNKFDNYFVVSADRQTYLGFEMRANLRDTSPLNMKVVYACENKGIKRCYINSAIIKVKEGDTFFFFFHSLLKRPRHILQASACW